MGTSQHRSLHPLRSHSLPHTWSHRPPKPLKPVPTTFPASQVHRIRCSHNQSHMKSLLDLLKDWTFSQLPHPCYGFFLPPYLLLCLFLFIFTCLLEGAVTAHHSPSCLQLWCPEQAFVCLMLSLFRGPAFHRLGSSRVNRCLLFEVKTPLKPSLPTALLSLARALS